MAIVHSNCLKMATRRKWRSWIQWTKLDFYQMSPHHTPQTVSKVTQTTPRHLPDTSQTPSRHPTDTPKYGTFWPISGNWEKRNKLMKMSQIGCLSIACKSYPPRQYPESLKQPQTPPRHIPDTLKTRQNMARFDQSKATGRKGTS